MKCVLSFRVGTGLCLLGVLSFLKANGMSAEVEQGRMVPVQAGSYVPFYRKAGENTSSRTSVKVKAFYLDVHPVTNAEYLEFLNQNPKWRKSVVKPVFADKNYLKHWKGDLEVGSELSMKSPVTNVSWFAAHAYCKWRGKRLPTVDQWEYAAYDSGKRVDEIRQRLLQWHSEPNPSHFPSVGSTPKNSYGVGDLHGLVWEWTYDFNSLLVNEESRDGFGGDQNQFCGSGSLSAKDASDYPTFLRYGFRSSLKAAFTVSNLGFRCSKEKE